MVVLFSCFYVLSFSRLSSKLFLLFKEVYMYSSIDLQIGVQKLM